MLWKLFLLFVTLPTLELLLLIHAARVLSFPGTIGLILLTGILGATLARQQGSQALRRIRHSLAQHHVPTTEVIDGFLILIAGVVLLTPGFITDMVGFLLLIPNFRAMIRHGATGYFKKHIRIIGAPHRPPAKPDAGKDFIDVDGGPVED